MLAAGAHRVLWVRTQQGALQEAIPRVRKEVAAATNMLIESNSILRFLRPDLYVAVLQPAVADFKPSALRYLDRADAIFVPEGSNLSDSGWPGVSSAILSRKPVFVLHEDGLIPEASTWFTLRMQALQASEVA